MNGIDQQVNDIATKFRSNPNQLQQQQKQSKDLIELLAMQKLKSEKEAAAMEMQMQMNPDQQTIAQQREKQVMDLTRNEVAQQVGGSYGQMEKQKQQAMQQMAQRAAPKGLGSLPRPPMGGPVKPPEQGTPPQGMAAGGIVALQEGGGPLHPNVGNMSVEDWKQKIRQAKSAGASEAQISGLVQNNATATAAFQELYWGSPDKAPESQAAGSVMVESLMTEVDRMKKSGASKEDVKGFLKSNPESLAKLQEIGVQHQRKKAQQGGINQRPAPPTNPYAESGITKLVEGIKNPAPAPPQAPGDVTGWGKTLDTAGAGLSALASGIKADVTPAGEEAGYVASGVGAGIENLYEALAHGNTPANNSAPTPEAPPQAQKPPAPKAPANPAGIANVMADYDKMAGQEQRPPMAGAVNAQPQGIAAATPPPQGKGTLPPFQRDQGFSGDVKDSLREGMGIDAQAEKDTARGDYATDMAGAKGIASEAQRMRGDYKDLLGKQQDPNKLRLERLMSTLGGMGNGRGIGGAVNGRQNALNKQEYEARRGQQQMLGMAGDEYQRAYDMGKGVNDAGTNALNNARTLKNDSTKSAATMANAELNAEMFSENNRVNAEANSIMRQGQLDARNAAQLTSAQDGMNQLQEVVLTMAAETPGYLQAQAILADPEAKGQHEQARKQIANIILQAKRNMRYDESMTRYIAVVDKMKSLLGMEDMSLPERPIAGIDPDAFSMKVK